MEVRETCGASCYPPSCSGPGDPALFATVLMGNHSGIVEESCFDTESFRSLADHHPNQRKDAKLETTVDSLTRGFSFSSKLMNLDSVA